LKKAVVVPLPAQIKGAMDVVLIFIWDLRLFVSPEIV
jgi:hypothetical protein